MCYPILEPALIISKYCLRFILSFISYKDNPNWCLCTYVDILMCPCVFYVDHISEGILSGQFDFFNYFS